MSEEKEDEGILSRLPRTHILLKDPRTNEYFIRDEESGSIRPYLSPQDSSRTPESRAYEQQDPDRFRREKVAGDSGVGFMRRLGASFFRGPQETEYLRKHALEEGETIQRGRGGILPETPEYLKGSHQRSETPVPEDYNELFIRGKDGQLRRIDPRDFDVGDLADMVGYIPEIVGGTAGAIKGAAIGGPVGAVGLGALGSMAGEGVRQIGAEVIDPEVHQFSATELGKAGLYGAGGELAPVALKTLGKGAELALHGPAAMLRRGSRGEVPQRVMENADRLGIERSAFPVSATTESPVAAGLDVHLRQSPFSRGVFQERDKALQRELEQGLGGIRKQIGGDVGGAAETAVSSNIDPEIVGKALIANDAEASALLSGSIADAGQAFESAVGRPMSQIRAVTPNLDRLAQTSGADLASQPGLKRLPEYSAQGQFFGETARDNLAQVMDLRRIAGDLMNSEGTRETGRKLYAAVMDDLDETFRAFASQAPLGELQASASAAGYKKILDISRRQYDVLDSPLVQKLFPHGRPNVHVMDQAAEMLSAGNVGPESVRLLKERLGVGMAEGSMTNFASKMKGRTDVGLPETSQGAFIWDQVQQLYLDNVLHKLSRVPGELAFGGQTFYNNLFGTAKQARVTQEIFGEATGDLKAFAELLRDSQISENFFKNWSNTGIYNELKEAVQHPISGALGALGKMGAAGQFARSQGSIARTEGGAFKQFMSPTENTLLGRQFFQRGDVPDIGAWLHAHRKLAGTVRFAAQVGGREIGGRYE